MKLSPTPYRYFTMYYKVPQPPKSKHGAVVDKIFDVILLVKTVLQKNDKCLPVGGAIIRVNMLLITPILYSISHSHAQQHYFYMLLLSSRVSLCLMLGLCL